MQRAPWTRAIRGLIPEARDIAVARTLADYGNKDGSNCHPGVNRLAHDCCMSTRTVQRSLAWLTEYGFLGIAQRASRRLGHSDVYELSIPSPVAVELGLLGAEHTLWVERPSWVPRHSELRDTAVAYNDVVDDIA